MMAKNRTDPLVIRLAGLALAWALAWSCRTPTGPRRPERLGEPLAGSQLPARGCIDGKSASIEDYRGVPGIGPRLAAALVEHCRQTHCVRGSPPEGVKGLGPVLAGRLGLALCPPAEPHPGGVQPLNLPVQSEAL